MHQCTCASDDEAPSHTKGPSCTTPRVPHNLVRHNAARNASNQESHWRHRSIQRTKARLSGAHSDNYVANTSGVNLVFYAITVKENAVVFNSRVGACIIRIRWIRVARLSSALACINRRCKMKEKRGKVQRLQKILVHHL